MESSFVWDWKLAVGTILSFFFAMLCAGSGIGGGCFYSIIFVILLQMDPHLAIPLSKITTFGVAVGGFLILWKKKHPNYKWKPLISYPTALMVEPLTIYGTMIGVVLNIISPSWLIIIVLVLLLGYTSYKTSKKALTQWKNENKKLALEKEQKENQEKKEKKDEINEIKQVTIDQIDKQEEEEHSEKETEVPLINTEMYEKVQKKNEIMKAFASVGILIVVWIVMFVIVILKGGDKMDSIVGVECGSAWYWVLTFIGFPLMLAVTICAYAGTSNILVVQQLMEVCGNHENNDELKECGIGVLGLALALLTDDLSTELAKRLIDEVQRYGESCVKNFIPFAIALTSIGKAKVPIMEQLSRLAHSTDLITARNAILSIGLVASGTQSTRAISLLDQLAAFYSQDSQALYAVKVAQGLVHLGKGTIQLNPLYSDRFLLDPIALSGLLTFIMISGEGIERIYGLNSYMINLLALAMKPRMIVFVDENENILETQVRIGQAVDIAGQAGNPKTITGFQTHTSPQVIGVGERAELADEDYIPFTSVLEGVVLVKKQ